MMKPVIVCDDPDATEGQRLAQAAQQTKPRPAKPAPAPKGKPGSKFMRRLAKHRKANRFARGGDQMPRERSDEAPLPYVCAVQVRRVDDRGRVTTKTSRPRRRR